MAAKRTGKSSTRKQTPARKKPARRKAAPRKAGTKKAARKKAGRKKAGRRGDASGGAAGGGAVGQPAGSDPRLEQIERLMESMAARGALEVELEDAAGKIRVRLEDKNPPPNIVYPSGTPLGGHVAAPPVSGGAQPGEPALGEGLADRRSGEVMTSPMVGTFYRAPSPEGEPFVRVGDRVGPDTTMCIIEAMKVMNEIKAEAEAEVVEILVENGQPVEFGQELFVLRTA